MRAERLDLVAEHLRRLDAHLEALVVGGHADRLVGAHHLEAVVPVGEADDALRVELLEQRGADRAFGDLVQLLVVVEDVRQVEHLELARAERPELRERGREHLHRAELQRLHLLAVLEQRAVGEHLDLDAALGALLGDLLEVLGGLALGRVDRDDVAELDDDRLLRVRRRPSTRARRCDHAESPIACSFHDFSSVLKVTSIRCEPSCGG